MITKEHVEYIAELARLKLDESEIASFTKQLGAVLGHVEQLNRVDTTGVEPTCFVVPAHDPLRDDVRRESLPRDEALRNAPSVKKGHFAVPKIIG
ncbi:MAG: Asp-tRNA(Asn)/Glu-tRNA(Gln) amidotransferase subunit GatC [Chitinivibrionales bacterium]|nr:Asp-tRNA(Asn)/Glu-tRNA(Gln) amidotransferase subunit GatC [Chitinivibrionales bacterium]MBD3394773.1 Asp-tRNA(Asn)/Glu-tRNA(Gln) amidotransferase subunit GatC [Chitinivibrionales bacterium]